MLFRNALVDQYGGCGQALIDGFCEPVFGGESGILLEGNHAVFGISLIHGMDVIQRCLPFQGR
jgi:hypothetical protein